MIAGSVSSIGCVSTNRISHCVMLAQKWRGVRGLGGDAISVAFCIDWSVPSLPALMPLSSCSIDGYNDKVIMLSSKLRSATGPVERNSVSCSSSVVDSICGILAFAPVRSWSTLLIAGDCIAYCSRIQLLVSLFVARLWFSHDSFGPMKFHPRSIETVAPILLSAVRGPFHPCNKY